MTFTASDVIALVAIVTGAMVSPVVAHVLQTRRDMRTLNHDRAQGARVVAAEAYGQARRTLRYSHPHYARIVAVTEEAELRLRQDVGEAESQLAVVMALGWTEDVRRAATQLHDEMDRVVMDFWAFVGALRRGHDATTYEDVETKWNSAWEALQVFRSTISGDAVNLADRPSDVDRGRD